ncbi:MAG: IMS domain-containing protein [Xenococcaceae cyanobacterium MO_188.B19]|nr:IMS domain-containing protein [Xenococcaceae cyanobacterium MO_188.B19]
MHISLDYYRILTVPIKANKQQIDRAYEDRIQQKPRREYTAIAIQARQSLLQQAHEILSDEIQRAKYDGKFLTKLKQEPTSIIETAGSQGTKKSESLNKIISSLDEAASLKASESFPQDQSVSPAPPKRNSLPQNQRALAAESYSVYPTIEISTKLLVGALIILHELGEYEQVIRLGNQYLNDSVYINKFKTELATQKSRQSNLASAASNSTSDDINPRKDIVLAMTLSYLELGREKWRIQDYETAACSAQMGFNLLQQEELFYMLQEELTTDLYKLRPYRILDLLANNSPNSPQRATGVQLLKEMLEQRQGIEGKGEDYSGLKFDKFLGFIQQVRNYLTTTEQIELFETEAKRASFVGTYLAMYALLAQGYATRQPNLILKAQAMLKILQEGQEEVHWEQAVCSLLLGRTKEAQNAIEQSQEKATVELIRQYSQNSPDLLPGLCFYGEKWLLREVLSQFRDLENCQVTLDEYFSDQKVQRYLDQVSPVSSQPQNTASVAIKQTVSKQKKGAFPKWASWHKPARKSVTNSVQVQGNSNSSIKPNVPAKSPSSTATMEKRPVTLPQNPTSQPVTAHSQVRSNKQPKKKRSSRRQPTSASLIKSSLLSLALILGLGSLGFVFTSNLLRVASESTQNVESQQPKPIAKTEPPAVKVSQAEIKPKPPEKTTILDNAIAKTVVETWLKTKSVALGNQHNVDQLNKILAPSQIGKWQGIALQDKRNNIYRQYKHNVEILKVNYGVNKPNEGTIEAKVTETTQYYQKGRSNAFKSDSDNLIVRYQLIRQGESWLINNSQVVKSF